MKFRKAVVLALLGMLAVTVVLPIMGCDNATNSSTSGGGGNPPSVDSYATTEKLDFETAKSGDKSLPFLTKESIKKMLQDTDQSKLPADRETGEGHYSETPSYTAPYKVGVVKQEALELALARLNGLRRLAGLPATQLDATLTEQAQYNAFFVGLYSSYEVGSKPADMDDSFYNKGKNVNTVVRNARPRIVDQTDVYLEDLAEVNLAHRMAVLQTRLDKVGFGVAPPNPSKGTSAFGGAAMQFSPLLMKPDDHANTSYDWEFVAWPAPGYFPINNSYGIFDAQKYKYWSIQFNPTKGYSLSTGSPATSVTVKRLNGAMGEWKLSLTGLPTASAYKFKLPDDVVYSDGDQFEVTITPLGMKYEGDKLVYKTISYTVEFFDVKK